MFREFFEQGSNIQGGLKLGFPEKQALYSQTSAASKTICLGKFMNNF